MNGLHFPHKIERKTAPGPDIDFDCPTCGKTPGSAGTRGTVERFLSFGFIPLMRVHFTDVTCNSCGTQFRLDRGLEAVVRMDPTLLLEGIRGRVPTFAKCLVVIGLAMPLLVASAAGAAGAFGMEMLRSPLFAAVTFAGFAPCAIGLAASFRKNSIWRCWAAAGLVPFLVSGSLALTASAPHSGDRTSTGLRPGAPREVPMPGGFESATRRAPGLQPIQPTPGSPSQNTFSVGEKVDGNWAGRWRPGIVKEIHGPFCLITFEDPERPREVSLPPRMVRPRK